MINEKDIPAEPDEKDPETRFQSKNEHPWGQARFKEKETQGQKKTHRFRWKETAQITVRIEKDLFIKGKEFIQRSI